MKLYIDLKKTAPALMLMGVVDAFEYKNNVKTENLIGLKLQCVIPTQKFASVNVAIPDVSKKDVFVEMLKNSEQGYVPIRLVNAEATAYVMNGKQGISIHADDAKAV